MQYYNIINYTHIIDLSILNYIDYLDIIEDTFPTNENNQLIINLNSKNKKILTGFIIDNINNNVQYGKTNIIVSTCKPMQNWRQYLRGYAVRSYKYNIIDESIYADIIKLNQFIDSVFCKLLTLDLSKISKVSIGNNTLELKHKQNIKCVEFENIDTEDIFAGLNIILNKIGFINFDPYTYNNIVIKDGNCDYMHNSECSGEILENIRRKLIEKEIL